MTVHLITNDRLMQYTISIFKVRTKGRFRKKHLREFIFTFPNYDKNRMIARTSLIVH